MECLESVMDIERDIPRVPKESLQRFLSLEAFYLFEPNSSEGYGVF